VSDPPQEAAGTVGTIPADTVLLADVGNSRIKLAVMAAAATNAALPKIDRRMDLESRSFHPVNLDEWLRAVAPMPAVVLVASVHDVAATRLEAMIAELAATQHRQLRQRRIQAGDLPLKIDLPEPAKVGIDRLAAAAATNRLRTPGRPAIVVDCGTAVTVDLLSDAGVFLGGAILPGAPLMAKGLADGWNAACRQRCRGRQRLKRLRSASAGGFAGRSHGLWRRRSEPWETMQRWC
jgi:type III pantothenate kinase